MTPTRAVWPRPQGSIVPTDPHAHLQQALLQAEAQVRECRALLETQEQHLNVLMHELRNPLSVILIALDAGADKPEHLDLARRAASEMRALLDYTLWADQAHTARAQMRRERVDVAQSLQALLVSLPGADRERLACSSPDHLVCTTDPVVVMVVMRNLIENACKYAHPEHPIHVSLSHTQASGTITLSVTNVAGPAGRPDPDRVFQKYYRAVSTKDIPGTGLGLHLSHSLAHALGGALVMESDADAIAFKLTLPCPNASE